jgi:tetratricopeptide (TPR) repeat protein
VGRLFVSHSTSDDAVVRALQQALGDFGQDMWLDSRELCGGDLLWSDIQRAIEAAAAYLVLVSPSGLQSSWVGKELRYALAVQRQRGKDAYPVVPLSLDGTKLGVLEGYFDEVPLYISIGSGAGGVHSAVDAILVALGKRAPADVAPTPQAPAEPMEELVLELTDLRLEQIEDGAPRATARARLVYEPATQGQRTVVSTQSWRFRAPLGPLEADDLRWYLQKYAIWPGGPFRDRARRVEGNLIVWGQLLHAAAMPPGPTDSVLRAWARVDDHASRRFSVQVDAACELGSPETDVVAARDAGTLLLGLPWELLHDGDSFLFQGAKPTRVRRRLPNTQSLDAAVVATPIRILLISARPEDELCSYIDHRASALPLIEAMEALPGQVELRVLAPPTLPALREELDRARLARQPYHVIHFDGHGVYDRRIGLGGLCFEHPDDAAKLAHRRHQTVYSNELGPLLRDHRIPLVFLEACQTALAEQASESVASELLQRGVASVIAMSHSVLIETARRLVTAFYAALARGGRVGAAMLEAQRHLKDDTLRGRIFGAGELRLEDWFVPVLFQEKDDPQLFRHVPAQQTRDDFQTALRNRLGALPQPPPTGFIGRSAELLTLERLLRRERYAVLRGQGGEGKTALAAEFARWMVRSQRCRRATFVSVEVHCTAKAVLDAIGRQLVGASYSVATADSLEQAEQPIARALREQPTLLVVDNLESILRPPYLADEMLVMLAENSRNELALILGLCERLSRHGETRFVFTSREALPPPFDGEINRHELHRLHRDDAVKLVERVAHEGGTTGGVADTERAAIEDLVEAVHGHARTLALLAPSLRRIGAAATREALVELMADMDRRFPGQREKSLFASVELSLRRLSPENEQRVRVLSVFHGCVELSVLRIMMDWDDTVVTELRNELIETGLAEPHDVSHLSLDPGLCPYLRAQLDDAERDVLTTRWVKATCQYASFLLLLRRLKADAAATATLRELPNLVALLAQLSRARDAETTIQLAGIMRDLLETLGRPRILAWIGEVREAAVSCIGASGRHVQFIAAHGRISDQLARGEVSEALAGAQALYNQANTPGEQEYVGAHNDLACASLLLGRVLIQSGSTEQALSCFDEAERRFQALEQPSHVGDPTESLNAPHMAATCSFERGGCLLHLGRLDNAAEAYEEGVRRFKHVGDDRGIAATKAQLGTVRLLQFSYHEALDAYKEAREQFAQLGESVNVAILWHQTGMTHRRAGETELAEDAYRHALAIKVQLGDVRGQASTVAELGNLYMTTDRLVEAAPLYRTAADHFAAFGDVESEGRALENLGETLRCLGRLDEARQAIHRAIHCKKECGQAAEPWSTWETLAKLEADAGRHELATQAKANARTSYLEFRRSGGDNPYGSGRISLLVIHKLLAGNAIGSIADLDQLLAHPNMSDTLRPFVIALREIGAGSRDRALADNPNLHYMLAAELLWVLDALEAVERAPHDLAQSGSGPPVAGLVCSDSDG